MSFDERRLKTASRIAAAIRPLDALGTCCSPSAVTIQTSLSADVEADAGTARCHSRRRHPVSCASSFSAPVLERAVAVLGGEADEQLAGTATVGERGEHVRCTDETQVQFPAGLILLELAAVRLRRAGSRRRRPPSAARRTRRSARRRHRRARRRFRTSTYSMPARARERHVGGDDRDVGAAPLGLLREREPHPPRRAVADEAHGVDRLARAARGDEHVRAVAASPPTAQRALDRGEQLRRLGQPADPELPGRAERARRRAPAPSRRARAASRGWPAWRDARTSRCSWPERRSAVAGTPARPPSAGCRRCPCASLASVCAVAGRDQVDVGALDQREVRERRVLGQRVARERRRATGPAPTR